MFSSKKSPQNPPTDSTGHSGYITHSSILHQRLAISQGCPNICRRWLQVAGWIVCHVFLECEKLWKFHGSTWYVSHLRNVSTPDPFRESCVHSSHLLRHQVWGNQSLSLRTIPAQLIISRHCLVLKSAGISPKSGAPLILSRTIWAHPVYQGNITAPSTWKAGFYDNTLSFNNLAFTVPDCCTGGPSNPEAVLVNMSKAAFQIGKNSVKRYTSWNAPNKVIPFAAENALETKKVLKKSHQSSTALHLCTLGQILWSSSDLR